MPRSSTRSGGSRSSGNRNDWGVMELARERPIAAAATAAGAAAAGLFLWSKRTQISDQLSNLSDQIGEWREGFGASDDTAGLTTTTASTATGTGTRSTTGRGRGRTATRGLSETGGGNASLGARTGGGGTARSATGRGRVRQAPTT